MKVVSWNVNSLRKRMQPQDSALARLLVAQKPDVVCLQELQCKAQQVPREMLLALGYDALVCAQKGKNGVAILTHTGRSDVAPALRYPWPPPGAAASVAHEARFVAADVGGVIVASVYAPYGRGREAPQWQEKLEFFRALSSWSKDVVRQGQCLLLAGDLNVAPDDADVHAPGEALFASTPGQRWPDTWAPWCHDEMRAAFAELVGAGLVDLGAAAPSTRGATIFDEKNFGRGTHAGVRVDHFLASLPLAARLRSMLALPETRAWPQTSDHCPIAADFVDRHRVFACLTGSHLHGTTLPSSDVDIKGIVLPSPKDFFLGRGCSKEVVQRAKAPGERNNALDVDICFFAPLDFVDMLASGQPVAWEMLFAPDATLLPDTTPLGLTFMHRLRHEAPRLLSCNTDALFGAVKQFTRRIEREVALAKIEEIDGQDAQSLLTATDGKKLAHAVRVLEQGCELMRVGAITLPRPNAAHLRDIKQNLLPLSQTLREIEDKKAALRQASESSLYAHAAQRQGAERAVAQLIGAHLGISGASASAGFIFGEGQAA